MHVVSEVSAKEFTLGKTKHRTNVSRLIQGIRITLLLVLLAPCLFAEYFLVRPETLLHSTFVQIATIGGDVQIQWMIMLCLGLYHAAFYVARIQRRKRFAQIARGLGPHVLIMAAMIVLVSYFLHLPMTATANSAIIFLIGVTLAQCFGTWAERSLHTVNSTAAVLGSLLIILVCAAVWWGDPLDGSPQYRGMTRWTGPWKNPNTFGLLMGVGTILALGQVLRFLGLITDQRGERIPGPKQLLPVSICSASAMCLAVGLLNSYSRGAWLGTAIACAWLTAQKARPLRSLFERDVSKPSKNQVPITERPTGWTKVRRWTLPACLIAASIGVIGFHLLRHTEQPLLRRMFSVRNTNDFSWRNRVIAYEGALQMMAQRPWIGFGSRPIEKTYEEFYQPPRLEDGAAINLNSYFMLAMTSGIPALFAFLAYLWIAYVPPRSVPERALDRRSRSATNGNSPAAITTKESVLLPPDDAAISILDSGSRWQNSTCQSAVIVLLVGFWFDGGLFHLALALPFWLLVEAAQTEPQLATSD